jgi:nitric oxide synthase oxygenase domain/subunit
MNITRTFGVGARRTIQTRLDIQNLFNYAGYSNPVTDPTNTNFGKVVAAASAAGAMRFFSFGLRYAF